MSGFDKVKIKVINNKNEIIIEDSSPRSTISYQKFYDYDEFDEWCESFLFEICKDLPEDSYTVYLDTLGAYDTYHGLLNIKTEVKRCYTSSSKL